ncbi:MAG TPA: head GIN domain-containing protein [Hanamia sp.]|nr:head GIN domain-containing protein [Hanamia sp.]
MKYLLVILFAAFTIPAMSQTVINDKNAEVRNVGSFSGIKVSGGIDVYLSQSNEYALAVSASEDKFRDEIKTEINNGVLTIYYGGGALRYNGNRKLRAYVSFKDLESIEASGACDITVNGTFKSNSLKVKLSGACEIKGAIAIENVQLNLSGASTVKLNGTVQNLKIDASGASDLKNYDLVADNCMADISGASDVKVTINKSISAKASGASSLYYKGNPDRKDISSSGASSISSRN